MAQTLRRFVRQVPVPCAKKLRPLLQRRVDHPLERCSKKLSSRVKIPVENRVAGMRTRMASIEQRICDRELNPAIRGDLRIWPNLSVAIPGPNVDLGKLPFGVLKLGAPLHGLDVKQLEVLNIDDARLPIEQQKTAVGIRSQGIGNPRKGQETLILKSRHNAKLAVTLLIKLARELYSGCWGAGS